MVKKIFGWILLVLGVLSIGWGVWSSYNIFTARKPVPELFETPQFFQREEKLPATEQEQIQQQIQQTIREQLSSILPPDFMPKVFNLGAWSIFIGILIISGGKVSGIGIRLLKD